MAEEASESRRRRPRPPAPGTFGAPSAWVFLVGCTPAEPTPLPQANKGSTRPEEDKQNEPRETTATSRRGLVRAIDAQTGGPQGRRGTEGSSRYQASADRQWANTDWGASACCLSRAASCADTYRSSSPASRAGLRPVPAPRRPRYAKPPVRAPLLSVSAATRQKLASPKVGGVLPERAGAFWRHDSGDQSGQAEDPRRRSASAVRRLDEKQRKTVAWT